jgi:hypothetical protein
MFQNTSIEFAGDVFGPKNKISENVKDIVNILKGEVKKFNDDSEYNKILFDSLNL